MADLKISQFDPAGALTGAEIIGFLQDGGNVRDTLDNVTDFIMSGSTLSIKVSLSSAEILALNGTPKTLVAAQGAGTFISVLSMAFRLNFNSVSYATNTTLQAEIGSFSPVVPINSILAQATNYWIVTEPTDTIEISGTPNWVNIPLRLTVLTGNPTAGNSTLDVYITYNVLTL